ncbi:DUF4124 domain-containing protein [Acinetobacter beijerinckii]|uniref:DUF4124 domain-containing protein n=1 Tax=Acinetobacter beijerinckii ANC 3835 TaxID=1217649 RepID=N9FLJ4_9GAMM|nr:DUF4124 domain-containing protein [Acinetobacter beijerinckii]ENW08195.1 hypothetical protein F934_00370 [Acinetobacter beijerinckii ANC 3835]
MKTFYLITALTLLPFSNSTFAQQYYKWVDKNGSTHYTTTPPPKGAKRLDKVSTYGASQPTLPQTTTASNQTGQAAQEASRVANAATETAARNSSIPQSESSSSHSDR